MTAAAITYNRPVLSIVSNLFDAAGLRRNHYWCRGPHPKGNQWSLLSIINCSLDYLIRLKTLISSTRRWSGIFCSYFQMISQSVVIYFIFKQIAKIEKCHVLWRATWNQPEGWVGQLCNRHKEPHRVDDSGRDRLLTGMHLSDSRLLFCSFVIRSPIYSLHNSFTSKCSATNLILIHPLPSNSFIHSKISIAPIQVHCYSEALPTPAWSKRTVLRRR